LKERTEQFIYVNTNISRIINLHTWLTNKRNNMWFMWWRL